MQIKPSGAPTPAAAGVTVLVVLLLLAASCAGNGAAPGAGERAMAAADGAARAFLSPSLDAANWLSHGRDHAETRFSPLDGIHVGNVGALGVAWIMETGTDRGLEATPLIVDGTIYTTGSWSVVYAVDARTGAERWRWDPEVDPAMGQRACCDVVNRGVAYADGKVFVGVLDGRLAALDGANGRVLWQTVTVDQTQPYTITGAPRVVAGRVIIGNGGAEYGVRGYVSAYDPDTGQLAWRFHTVPGDPSLPPESPAMRTAAETWTGEWWRYGGGGTVWDALAYDPELELLYVGTGNGSPWNREVRSPGGGDNLFLSSVVALRAATGEYVWHYQTTPGDTWDFTATQQMILADLTLDGRPRKVLMQAPKNGFFYVLDRVTGQLLSAEPFADEVTWATHVDRATGRPVEVPAARYVEARAAIKPGPYGAHNWHPMSFNPATGLVYIPVHDAGMSYAQTPGPFVWRDNAWNTGVSMGAIPGARPSGHLLAWDPVRAEERWRVPLGDIWNGGTLTTAGNLVFQGTSDGRFVAYRADTGEALWEVILGGGVIAAPSTYAVDGVQHVVVMVGWGGVYGVTQGRRTFAPGRMVAFRLGGAQLPAGGQPTADAGPARPTPSPIPSQAAPAVIAAGAAAFAQWCAACHGQDAVSMGILPDLRYAAPETFDGFADIVLGGARQARGMPSFGTSLTPAQAEAIRAYLLDRRAAIPPG
jgi:quinohemoprotein ethanol dehydrogenase